MSFTIKEGTSHFGPVPSGIYYLVIIVNAGLEHILGHAAQRAAPVSRKVFKSCAGFDSVLRITLLRIICIAAGITKIFLHNVYLLSFSINYIVKMHKAFNVYSAYVSK